MPSTRALFVAAALWCARPASAEPKRPGHECACFFKGEPDQCKDKDAWDSCCKQHVGCHHDA
eukprot:gene9790-54057_t